MAMPLVPESAGPVKVLEPVVLAVVVLERKSGPTGISLYPGPYACLPLASEIGSFAISGVTSWVLWMKISANTHDQCGTCCAPKLKFLVLSLNMVLKQVLGLASMRRTFNLSSWSSLVRGLKSLQIW